MSKQQTDYLFKLIKSLTKSEKRNFKLYVNRINSGENTKFITLFDLIDKQAEYDENKILQKATFIKKTQLPNIKAHLYKNLLVSLRLNYLSTDIDISLRQQLDYAKILYNKALYRQSLNLLERTKQLAWEKYIPHLYFQAVEFEKLIESQYVTHSIETKAEELTSESENITQRLSYSSAYSNLAIRLYGLFLKKGYVKNSFDKNELVKFYTENLPQTNRLPQGFYEKLNYAHAHVWFYFIQQDFIFVYRHAFQWVNSFHNKPEMIYLQTDLYIKGLGNLLESLFFLSNYERFTKYLNLLENLKNDTTLPATVNNKVLIFQYLYDSKINSHFMDGSFDEGVKLVPVIEKYLSEYELFIDDHRVFIFYYKIATLYFGNNDLKNTIKYLNKIINMKDVDIRSDIHCFARILNLIAHYELGNMELMEYLVKSVYRFLLRNQNLHQTMSEVLLFLKRLPAMLPQNLKIELAALRERLLPLRNHRYEKRTFLYLDIISWIESKLSNKTIQQIIKDKRKKVRSEKLKVKSEKCVVRCEK